MGLLGKRKYSMPADDFGNVTGGMETFISQKVTLADSSRLKITAPAGSSDAVVSSSSTVTVYESATVYGSNNEYGNGMPGTNISIPVTGGKDFWISGTAGQVVNIMFPKLRE